MDKGLRSKISVQTYKNLDKSFSTRSIEPLPGLLSVNYSLQLDVGQPIPIFSNTKLADSFRLETAISSQMLGRQYQLQLHDIPDATDE